jgi:hypothetical protein
MAGERFTGERGTTVPARGNGELRCGRDDNVCGVRGVSLGGPGCDCGFFAALAVFGERLAGENDRLYGVVWGFVMAGSVVHAIERRSGSEATGGARLTVIAASTVASIAAVVAIIAIAASTVSVTTVVAIVSSASVAAVDVVACVASCFG